MNERLKSEILVKAEQYVRKLFDLKSDWDMTEFKLNEKAAEIKFESGDDITIKVKMDLAMLYPHSERTPDGQGALWPDKPSDLYVGNQDGVLLTAADRGEKPAPCPGCEYWGDEIDANTDEPLRDAEGKVIKGCQMLFAEGEECGPANNYRDFSGTDEPGPNPDAIPKCSLCLHNDQEVVGDEDVICVCEIPEGQVCDDSNGFQYFEPVESAPAAGAVTQEEVDGVLGRVK